MKTIGLTGGIASGKSTVARIIQELGFPVISADRIARQVVEPGQPEYHKVVRLFGPEVLLADQSLDRRKLAAIVFADPKLRAALEQIIHPAVKTAIRRQAENYQQTGLPALFVEVPLLYESGMADFFDAVWVVTADATLQQQRLQQRDALSMAEAKQRMASQWPIAEKVKLADRVIENNRGITELKQAVMVSLAALMQ